jgi:predicted nucleic-acid-binding Zn-ribbon protein
MDSKTTQLVENFICPKCRGRNPLAREVVLSKNRFLGVLPAGDDTYIEITCSLCGYTEFYNRAIVVRGTAACEDEIRLTEKAKANGG